VLGLITSALGLLMGVYFILSRLFEGILIKNEIPAGWASLIVCVTVFSGLQLCVLGVIGEYLGRLFLTMNRTPQFVVRESYGVENEPAGTKKRPGKSKGTVSLS
jgi:undecaprenyl-phosphate 4-deoxy-4-formamido-L-arabinose transferase